MSRETDVISLSAKKIIFRNFAGAQGKFNPAGRRNFSVILTAEEAEKLKADGWNVKMRPAKDDYTEPLYHLPIAVSYANYPPKVWIVSSAGKKLLDEDTVNIVDYADIESCDMTISPYTYQRDDGSYGIKAYLRSMFITIYEDEIDRKYADTPDIS